MFQLFESIKIENGIVQNIEYHQNRVDKYSNLSLKDVVSSLSLPCDGVHKLRISYDIDGRVSECKISPYSPRTVKSLRLIHCDTIYYAFKSENRTTLNKLFDERETCDDILIIKNGYVTDTSYSNIIFRYNDKWFTPSTPLLEGTCRARLIDEGIITICDIKANDLSRYSQFMIINAMLDFDINRANPIENIIG